MVKTYSTAEFRILLLSLIDEVEEKRKIAESQNKRFLEINVVNRVQEPYISMIRDYFISQEYNVFFIKKFDMTPAKDFRKVSIMRLEWW